MNAAQRRKKKREPKRLAFLAKLAEAKAKKSEGTANEKANRPSRS